MFPDPRGSVEVSAIVSGPPTASTALASSSATALSLDALYPREGVSNDTTEMSRIEKPWSRMLASYHRPGQKRRGREEHDGHGHLNGEQEVAQRQTRARHRHAGFQRVRHAAARAVQRRRETERDARKQREAERVAEHPGIRPEVQRGRTGEELDDSRRQPQRHRQSGTPGEQREREALREELPDDARPAGAERQPNGDLTAPRRGAREEQVPDVGAGQQQDQHHTGKDGREHLACAAARSRVGLRAVDPDPARAGVASGAVSPVEDGQLRLCLFARRTGRKPAGGAQAAGVRLARDVGDPPVIGPEQHRGRDRHPDIDAIGGCAGKGL